MKPQLTTWLLLGAVAFATSPTRGGDAEAGTQRPAALDREVRVQRNYLLYLPEDYEAKEAWPLLLFLHGSGERGSDLEQVKRHGPPKLIAEGRTFPFLVVSPQCPEFLRWHPLLLTALLDDVVAKYRVDEDRIYVTGLSMGGYGAWALAAYAPQRFAAVVPICGGGDPAAAQRMAHLPIWVFHGAKDKGVPLKESERMVDALKKAGGDVKFTVYPDAGHDSWTQTYDNPELYEWLLRQKRFPETRGETADDADGRG